MYKPAQISTNPNNTSTSIQNTLNIDNKGETWAIKTIPKTNATNEDNGYKLKLHETSSEID